MRGVAPWHATLRNALDSRDYISALPHLAKATIDVERHVEYLADHPVAHVGNHYLKPTNRQQKGEYWYNAAIPLEPITVSASPTPLTTIVDDDVLQKLNYTTYDLNPGDVFVYDGLMAHRYHNTDANVLLMYFELLGEEYAVMASGTYGN